MITDRIVLYSFLLPVLVVLKKEGLGGRLGGVEIGREGAGSESSKKAGIISLRTTMMKFLTFIFFFFIFVLNRFFLDMLPKFQSSTNVRPRGFYTIVSESVRPPLVFLVPRFEIMTSFSQKYHTG